MHFFLEEQQSWPKWPKSLYHGGYYFLTIDTFLKQKTLRNALEKPEKKFFYCFIFSKNDVL